MMGLNKILRGGVHDSHYPLPLLCFHSFLRRIVTFCAVLRNSIWRFMTMNIFYNVWLILPCGDTLLLNADVFAVGL